MCVKTHTIQLLLQFSSLSEMREQQTVNPAPCCTVNPAPLLYCGTFILSVVVGQGVRFTDGPGAVVGVQTLDTDRCPYSVLIGVGVYLDVTVVI